VTVYAESSAVLAWLLDQDRARAVEEVLGTADGVTTSALTMVECERALLRLERSESGIARQAAEARSRLGAVVDAWGIQPITESILRRARQSFPDDAIRSLDAIHLATALVMRASIADLALVSLDGRIRANGVALGMLVLPA
jgi:predicted nucleic acid-binding protein